MQIRGVLFDKDGTLFDFNASWGKWAAALITDLADDQDHQDQLAQALGYDWDSQTFLPHSRAIAGTSNDVLDLLLPVLPGVTPAQLLAQISHHASALTMVEVLPLAPFLGQLRDIGLCLGVATNDSEPSARKHLQAYQIEGLFDFIAGYDSGFGAKPAPGMCQAFAQHHDLDPAQVMMVGDSLHDLRAGRAAGMLTVAVLTGVAKAPELEPYADYVLQDIGGLLPLIRDRIILTPQG